MSRARTIRVAAASALLAACGTPGSDVTNPPVATIPFGEVVVTVARLPLSAIDTGRSVPVGVLTSGSTIVVLDRTRALLRIFARPGGELRAVAGTPGDARGQLRKPAAIAPMDSGQFVVLDAGRRVLSLRDSLGLVLREAALPEGSYTSIVPIPGERRVIVAGRVFYGPDSIRQRDLHEFDLDGRYVTSFGTKADATSLWARAFSTVVVAGTGRQLASATMSTNKVRLLDRRGGGERWMRVAPTWYVVPEFPHDRVLSYRTTQQTASSRVTAWTRQQRLLNGLFPLTGGRMVARFQAFDPSGKQFYYYAFTDNAGATWAVSRPTRVNVLEARGDTLSWIETSPHGRSTVVTGVVNAAHVPGTVTASRAP